MMYKASMLIESCMWIDSQEDVDFPTYFDHDLPGASGNICGCFIIPEDCQVSEGYNLQQLEQVKDQAVNILNAFQIIKNNRKGITHKVIMERYGITYTSRRCHYLREWASFANPSNGFNIESFLTIITGKVWRTLLLINYSLKSKRVAVYCPECYSQEHINQMMPRELMRDCI